MDGVILQLSATVLEVAQTEVGGFTGGSLQVLCLEADLDDLGGRGAEVQGIETTGIGSDR